MSMSESARLSVLDTKRTKQAYEEGMYKTQEEKKKPKEKPPYSHTTLEGDRTENEGRNSSTRTHSVDDRTFRCHKAKALSLRLCSFQKLMEVLYIHWNNMANVLVYSRTGNSFHTFSTNTQPLPHHSSLERF